MFKRSLISMAALAAASGFVFAAEPAAKPDGSNKSGSSPTTSAPAPTGESADGKGDMKSDDLKPGKSGEMKSGEAKSDVKSGEMKKGDTKQGDAKNDEAKSGDMKSGDTKSGDTKSGDTKSGEIKPGDVKPGDAKNAETKAGAKGDKAALSKVTPEQKTQVKTVFTKHRVEPAQINVSVNIGVAIPRETRLYSVPEDIVIIAPAYRDYRYFIIGDRVCIVDPDTFEIVDIIIIA